MLYHRSITLLLLLCFVVLPAKAQVTGLGSTMFENSGAEKAQDCSPAEFSCCTV